MVYLVGLESAAEERFSLRDGRGRRFLFRSELGSGVTTVDKTRGGFCFFVRWAIGASGDVIREIVESLTYTLAIGLTEAIGCLVKPW
jgi:hypothetical protein